MAFNKTFSQIIIETERRLSQVSGTSTQLYSEDRIGDIIKFIFDQLFDQYNWPQYKYLTQSALDESTGVVVADLSSNIKDFTHLEAVFIENTNTKIPFLPTNINPYTITGTIPRYIERNSNAAKVFTVWPLAATGNLTIKGKTKPTEFISTDVINFDHQTLVLGAAWDYLQSDGTNLEDAQKFGALFQARVKEMVKQLSGDIVLDAFSPTIPTEWV